MLSVSHKLTIWCQGQTVWFQEPDGSYDRLSVTDLNEAVERIVAAHEDLVVARQIVPAVAPSGPEVDAGPEDGIVGYSEPDLYRRW